MRPFKHIQASSIEEAAALAAHEDVMVIAGGTDLIGTLKDECLPYYPNYIVDLKTIPGLDAIEDKGEEIVIGPLVKLQDIADSELVKTQAQALAEACGRAASPTIRQMGTLGGNICQMHRCWYFRCPDNRLVCARKGEKSATPTRVTTAITPSLESKVAALRPAHTTVRLLWLHWVRPS